MGLGAKTKMIPKFSNRNVIMELLKRLHDNYSKSCYLLPFWPLNFGAVLFLTMKTHIR